jgi:hypothetical protein
MKKLLIGVAVIVVAVVGGVVFFASNIDAIIKTAVEDIGSKATRTQVTLAEVEVSITSGEGALRGFSMGNPDGFKTKEAMVFDSVSVKIDTDSVTKDVIVIKEVVIAAPRITYELGGGGSNIQTIQKNVDSYAKSMGAGGDDGKPAEESEGGTKVIIEHLYVRDGTIGVSAAFLAGKQMNVPLPNIHMKDIGKKKGGASPAEVADQLLSKISQSATGAVSGLGLDKMMDKAKDAAAGAQKMLEGGAGEAQKAFEGATKGIGDSLKGVFGK